MPNARTADWQAELGDAVRAAKAVVTGWRHVEHFQHGLLLKTALAAFGDDRQATFFIECLAPNTNMPRPDLIILHPQVGVLTIENKGITLEQIHAVEHTAIHLTRDGRLKEEDPFAQAARVMYAMKDLVARRHDLREVLLLRTAAFPRIRRFEFEKRFDCSFPIESLFADACHDPQEFREQVLAYSKTAFHQQGKSERLSRRAHDLITGVILSGKSIFTPPRRIQHAHCDPGLMGAEVQELELSLKTATQQQKDLGRADLRGAHRLFRGVAGSGKSIMLALSAAQTLLLHREDQQILFEPSPPKRILVTCYNRALVQYLRGKITERFARIAWDKPSDSELHVTHFEGLIKLLAGQRPRLRTQLSYDQKSQRSQLLCERFDALPPAEQSQLQFDAVYVDETQDLEPAELEFLRRLAKPDPRGNQTLILFYDNAQNIYGTNPPTWSNLGINIIGRTQFLDQCLRNTRQIIAFAFNVLVGSYAPDHFRVRTRQFADVASLRQRGLIEEIGPAFDIRFAPREGPAPRVSIHTTRRDEILAAVAEIRRLIHVEHVLPSDILILYNSHHPFKTELPGQIEKILPPGYSVRLVDIVHRENKNLPLLEDTVLTLSTIASAKGYDSPIVFLLGVDLLSTTDSDRARFYVAATRAKLLLYIFATKTNNPSLLAEIAQAAKGGPSAPSHITPPIAGATTIVDEPSRFQDLAVSKTLPPPVHRSCMHCHGHNLHCQQGGAGYYLLCIDCTQMTPLPRRCSKCGEVAKIHARQRQFFRICTRCSFREIVHTNKPLETF